MLEKLLYEDLFIGMQVKDSDRTIGIIKEIRSIEYILVEYPDGWMEIHSLDENLLSYDPLYKI
jgi:hypothetical protein